MIPVTFRRQNENARRLEEGLLARQIPKLILVRERIPHYLKADIAVRVSADDAATPADDRVNAGERSGRFRPRTSLIRLFQRLIMQMTEVANAAFRDDRLKFVPHFIQYRLVLFRQNFTAGI